MHPATLLLMLAPLLVAAPATARAGEPAAPAPVTVRAGLPATVPEGAVVGLRDADGRILYWLTPGQVRRLRRAGATLDAHELAGARLLARRRFDADAFVQAVADAARHGELSARCIEGAAVWRVTGLPWKQLERFCDSGQALSTFLAEYRDRARRLERAGHVVVAVSAVVLAAGLATGLADAILTARCEANADPEYGSECWGGFITLLFGTPLLGAGTLGLAAGIPLAVVGRRRRLAATRPDAVLDQGSPEALRRYARRRELERSAADGPTLSLGAGPARSTGLSLQLRF